MCFLQFSLRSRYRVPNTSRPRLEGSSGRSRLLIGTSFRGCRNNIIAQSRERTRPLQEQFPLLRYLQCARFDFRDDLADRDRVVSTVSGIEWRSDDIKTQGSTMRSRTTSSRSAEHCCITRKRCSDLHRFMPSMLRETRVYGISLLTKFNDAPVLANAFVAERFAEIGIDVGRREEPRA